MTLSAVGALIERDYRITRSYRLAFGLDLIYGIVEVSIYYFISKTFAHVSNESLSGAPTYFAFATVGIIVTLIIASASTGITQRLREEQLAGTLEALTDQPVKTWELAIGWAGFPLVFGFVRAAIYTFFAIVVFGLGVSQASAVGLAVVLLATAAAMLGLGIVAAAVTIVFKRGGTFAAFAIFGMSVLSGSVFPVSVLPGWLEPIAKVLPPRFALDGARHALFRGADWAGPATALAAFAVVAIPASIWLLHLALLQARKSGTIGQY